jgi:hypothetical protein
MSSMLVLTPAEAKEFLIQNHLLEDPFRIESENAHTEYTADVGRRCAYANLLTNHLITSPDSIVCLDITYWGAWESSQNLDLFYSYRKYLGEQRNLIDAHFHVFKANEANECRNILHLALISLFDVEGASTTTDFRFYASNDEWIDVPWPEGAEWRESMEWFFKK